MTTSPIRFPFPPPLDQPALVGPHAYLVGCRVEDRCFIATGSIVFNGAHLKRGCRVTLGGIVHIGTTLEDGQVVPLQHVAIGTPATVFPPGDTQAMMEALGELNFASLVFGVEREGRTSAEITESYVTRYVRGLAARQQDVLLDGVQGAED